MNLLINKSNSLEKLIADCKKNSAKAQRELYDKYSGLMFSICKRYTGESTQAEDTMINGFMKIFNNIGQYTGAGSFEGWMKRIIVNESLMFIRKNKNMYLEVDIEAANFEPNYDNLNNKLEADDLMKMVNQLPMGYKTVFNLYAIEGFSHKEIAEKLNINVNTSKSQLSRARALLQNKLVESEKILNNNSINYEE